MEELKERVLTFLREMYMMDSEMAEMETTEIQSMLDCAHDPCTIQQVREALVELGAEDKVLHDDADDTWLALGAHISFED